MSTTTLLIDLDGVIITPRHKYFSDRLSEEYNIPIKDIMEFFKNEYGQAARGQVSIREVLPKYLELWGWKSGIDAFLKYWFEGEKDLNEELISQIQRYREQGIKVYIVSDNEQERAEYIMRELNLNSVVDGAFYSYQIGAKKSESEFFESVITRLGVSKEEIIYIDDDPKNIEIARLMGINSEVFTRVKDLEKISDLPEVK